MKRHANSCGEWLTDSWAKAAVCLRPIRERRRSASERIYWRRRRALVASPHDQLPAVSCGFVHCPSLTIRRCLQLYCDSCAHRVEVGFYDPTVIAVDNEIIEKLGKMNRASLMNAIEPRLRLCVCGGRFRDRSSRRCHVCQAEVIVDDQSWDLWPG